MSSLGRRLAIVVVLYYFFEGGYGELWVLKERIELGVEILL